MSIASDSLALGWDVALRPSRAVDRILAAPESALRPATGILALYMLVSAVFYWLKPDSFPPPPEAYIAPENPRSLFFWVRVQLWTPPLAAVLIATTGWFSGVLKGGKLPFRLTAAVLSAAIPVLLLVLHAGGRVGTPLFTGVWLLLLGLMVPGWRAIERRSWLALAGVLLAANAPALALVPVFAGAVVLRTAMIYHALEMLLLFWTLGVCAYGVGRTLGIPTARAFAAVFLGFIAQIFFVFSMHNAGLLPKDVLKALMAV